VLSLIGADSEHDVLSALVRWVETGSAPDKLIAVHSRNDAIDRTRALCPYPKTAHWNGRGSSDEAGNFTCVDPAMGGTSGGKK
jgi:feruloyl esterase